jgi:D-3-phosphoglycerate dehydrogenase
MGVETWLKDCKTEEEIIATGRSADFIITISSRYPYTRRVLEGLDKCKFIETIGAGYNGIDMEAAADCGIGIVQNADYHIEELSDHTMALILSCARRIVQLDRIMKETGTVPGSREEVRKIWPQMIRLTGKTLGLIGFGRIARALAPKARVFGMKIVAYDPYVPKKVAEELEVRMLNLEQLLEEADFVSIHTALTSETDKLIGLEQFKRMKSDAFIINTARGAVIDEPALYRALAEGYIAGAGLDVTAPEPPAVDSPILKFDNVILTGHSAHSSPESWLHRINRPPEEVARVMRGEWPIGLVNFEIKEKYTEKWGEVRNPACPQ